MDTSYRRMCSGLIGKVVYSNEHWFILVKSTYCKIWKAQNCISWIHLHLDEYALFLLDAQLDVVVHLIKDIVCKSLIVLQLLLVDSVLWVFAFLGWTFWFWIFANITTSWLWKKLVVPVVTKFYGAFEIISKSLVCHLPSTSILTL